MSAQNQHPIDQDHMEEDATMENDDHIDHSMYLDVINNDLDAVLQQYFAAFGHKYEEPEAVSNALASPSDMGVQEGWWSANDLVEQINYSGNTTLCQMGPLSSFASPTAVEVDDDSVTKPEEAILEHTTMPREGDALTEEQDGHTGIDDQSDPPQSPEPSKTTYANLCLSPDCGKSFKYPKDLRRHLLTHTRERPHVCPDPECKYYTEGFPRKDALRRHLEKVHAAKFE